MPVLPSDENEKNRVFTQNKKEHRTPMDSQIWKVLDGLLRFCEVLEVLEVLRGSGGSGGSARFWRFWRFWRPGEEPRPWARWFWRFCEVLEVLLALTRLWRF